METDFNLLLNGFSKLDKQILTDYFYKSKCILPTKKNYIRILTQFKNFIKKDICNANIDDCRRYIQHISEVKSKNKRKFSISTTEMMYSTLYAIFEFICKNKATYCLSTFENWFYQIPRPQADRNLNYNDIIPSHDLENIIDYLKKGPVKDYAMFALIFTSALSAEEVSNLTWNQFLEDAAGHIAIEYNLDYGHKRYVLVTEDTWHLLLEFRKQKYVADTQPVFFSRKSEKISATQIRRIFKKVCTNALDNTDITKDYTISQLRDTAIAYALCRNIDRNSLCQQLGYSDLRPTRRYDSIITSLYNSTGSFLNFS